MATATKAALCFRLRDWMRRGVTNNGPVDDLATLGRENLMRHLAINGMYAPVGGPNFGHVNPLLISRSRLAADCRLSPAALDERLAELQEDDMIGVRRGPAGEIAAIKLVCLDQMIADEKRASGPSPSDLARRSSWAAA